MGKLLITLLSKTFIDGELVSEGPASVDVGKLYPQDWDTAVYKEEHNGKEHKTFVNVSDKRSLNLV